MKQEDFDKVFKEMDNVFDSMTNTFKHMDKTFTTLEEFADKRLQSSQKWQVHKLIFPKRVKGRWYWPGNKVYRKFVLSPGGGFWQYGDVFDAIKDADRTN